MSSSNGNTCKNCIYWKEGDRFQGVGKCYKAKQLWNFTDWDDNCEEILIDKEKSQKMFVNDGSSYYAELLTRDDFGCNQFEEK